MAIDRTKFTEKPVLVRVRTRLAEALENGHALRGEDKVAAEAALAYERFLRGEKESLSRWPGLAALAREAAAPRKPGRKKKEEVA